MKLVYVAGPFRCSDGWTLAQHVRQAETAAFNPTAMITPAAIPPETPAPDPAPTVTQRAPTVTLEQVRASLAPAAKANKTTELAALFAEFGAQKLTDVAPENYAALIARAATL